LATDLLAVDSNASEVAEGAAVDGAGDSPLMKETKSSTEPLVDTPAFAAK
jgi:hypothetical protein